jgi:beta-barrel assembly-enhancing protease
VQQRPIPVNARSRALAALLIGVFAVARVSAAANLYSLERETALGKQLAVEVERQVKLADDPILVEYVNRVAQKIAHESDLAFPVTVKVIESGELNAFTLPAGHIYVNTAMLRLTESEAELAFVLAHEIGHVSARHSTEQASVQQLTKIGTIPLVLLSGGWARALAELAAEPGLKKVAREFETQADQLGITFLARCGYDPTAAVDFFERIEGAERKTPGRVARLYGDHPITASRIGATEKRLNAIVGTRTEWVINTSEYEEMRLRMVAIEERREQEAGTVSAPALVHGEKR